MKNREENKKLIRNILLYLGFIIIASGHIFYQTLSNLDEIWVYNFARGIVNRIITI